MSLRQRVESASFHSARVPDRATRLSIHYRFNMQAAFHGPLNWDASSTFIGQLTHPRL